MVATGQDSWWTLPVPSLATEFQPFWFYRADRQTDTFRIKQRCWECLTPTTVGDEMVVSDDEEDDDDDEGSSTGQSLYITLTPQNEKVGK